ENFPAKGGPLGLGLLPKCPTMPAEAFMAAVTALSRPTSQELRARMASKGTVAAGTAAAVGEEEGAERGREEGAEEGTRRSRDGRGGFGEGEAGPGEGLLDGVRVATLAAVSGLDDDDVRLRILVRKAKTWTGRVAETWELLPEYPAQLLLPPLQPEPAVLLDQQQAQAPSPQPGESYLAPPQPPEAVQGGGTAAVPLFSRLLPRRRTLG
ncbi:hypothetical protein Agub_g2885, partial [Astrephomene gubernaculifera]